MSYKEDTHSLLMQKYEELGLQKMITIARAMLENTDYKKSTDFIAHMHGEVYLKKNTQIDIIFIHPKLVCVIELKNWTKYVSGSYDDVNWNNYAQSFDNYFSSH